MNILNDGRRYHISPVRKTWAYSRPGEDVLKTMGHSISRKGANQPPSPLGTRVTHWAAKPTSRQSWIAQHQYVPVVVLGAANPTSEAANPSPPEGNLATLRQVNSWLDVLEILNRIRGHPPPPPRSLASTNKHLASTGDAASDN